MPYGQRVLDKIEGIIDDELELIECQKLSMPNLLSSENWKKTGRWESTGQEMFKLKDRKGADFLLAPTHEEEVTALIAKDVQSYRQLPVRVYQVTRKFRDELRARSGLLRGKEFVMKDLYTFDVSAEEALKTYDEVVVSYKKILNRIGVPFAVVCIVSRSLLWSGLSLLCLTILAHLYFARLRQILATLEEHIHTSSIFSQEVIPSQLIGTGP